MARAKGSRVLLLWVQDRSAANRSLTALGRTKFNADPASPGMCVRSNSAHRILDARAPVRARRQGQYKNAKEQLDKYEAPAYIFVATWHHASRASSGTQGWGASTQRGGN